MSHRARSLRRRLTVTVIAVVGVALAAPSTIAYFIYGQNQRDRFDERLADVARAVALAIGKDGSHPAEFESGLPGIIDQSRGATSVQIWNDEGSVLARYSSLGGVELRPPDRAQPTFETVRLEGGGEGRLYRASLGTGATGSSPSAPRRTGIAVLRATERLEWRLAQLRGILLATTLVTMLLAGMAAWLLIRRSFHGLVQVSNRIASIDPLELGVRVSLGDLPDELRPPFEKVNELLARIEQVMSRERQFSADVSHELRNPLAGLRAILEVSGSRDRTAAEYRDALQEALEVVRQLEAIVENLLALARLGAGQLASDELEEIEIRALVDASFTELNDFAQRRRLQFDNWVTPMANVRADRLKLRIIASNLLSNAVQYTAEGGWITVESDPSEGLVLRVRDSGPAIPASALAKVFDPFYRVAESRSEGGDHFGIGLTLVRGLCESSGFRVTAENEPGGAVAFSVTKQVSPGAWVEERSPRQP